ncbi:MAG TPA: hypothetical protein VJ343_00640, partial [archaeon]|nr:hypothetical protein [archaeon]
EIKVGNKADITVLNIHRSEKISSESLYSKGASPYVGIDFPGRVEYVVYNGEIVLEDGEVLI